MHGTVGVFVADFDEPDPSDAYQIVGYQEYANALNNLVPLVRAADEASLRVYDKIISDMPELVIYTNLSRRFGLVQMQNFSLPPRLRNTSNLYRQSSLNETGNDANAYKRSGIGWLIALARLEHGSIEIGYQTNVSPFNLEELTKVETPAFSALLLDGARSHYWAMKMDSVTHYLIEGNVPKVSDRTALAYGRRAVLVQEMLKTLNQLAGRQFTPAQKQELQSWYKNMSAVREGVVYNVYETYKVAIAKKGIGNIELKGCPPLVSGIRDDILRGRASISLEE
ncbi:MAG: hypothetical protein CMJ55_00035 [Planctomycetaceae bacterium]|nr:hypothetical protein [Planctomycetaceae bacterium]